MLWGVEITDIPDSRTRVIRGGVGEQMNKNTRMPDSRTKGPAAPAVLVIL